MLYEVITALCSMLSLTAFATTSDPLQVVNNLSDFIFGVITSYSIHYTKLYDPIVVVKKLEWYDYTVLLSYYISLSKTSKSLYKHIFRIAFYNIPSLPHLNPCDFH